MRNKDIPKHAGIWEDFGPSHVDSPIRLAEPSAHRGQPGAGGRTLRRIYLSIVASGSVVLVLLLGVLGGFLDASALLPAALLQAGALILLAVVYRRLRFLTEAVLSLAFFRRFIRPGLRRLLEQKEHIGDEKLFRGRKAVIMKIDMVDYTQTTFYMPYGMRRLFQDLWFTLIDQVVADKVFLDKNLGDGSLYCFEDALPGGSAATAFTAALEIRDRQVELFDATYLERLDELLAATPELVGPTEAYLDRYAERQGQSFRQRRTRVRIALVTGYVDEGLWGLSSQSHYDVQGPPPILASRIEAAAENGEIVLDQDFLEELEEEKPGLVERTQLEKRSVELKGIGSRSTLR